MRTDDEIITTGPRDWEEAQRVQEMLAKTVNHVMREERCVQRVLIIHAKRLLDLMPMVATLRAAEARRLERAWSANITVPVDRSELDWFISILQESAPPMDSD